jgi:hypothetical protein
MNTTVESPVVKTGHHHFRFHLPHRHLSFVFGNDWFALKAEASAPLFRVADRVHSAPVELPNA